jgi:hypothetical protein
VEFDEERQGVKLSVSVAVREGELCTEILRELTQSTPAEI